MNNYTIVKRVQKFIYDNFDGKEIELYDYLYENIESIAKEIGNNEEFLEYKLIDRDSECYLKLVEKIILEDRTDIRIEEKGPLYYIVRHTDINVLESRQYYKKINYILNNIDSFTKGHLYEKFILLFFIDIGFKISEHKKTSDGGLDIIAHKIVNDVISGVNIQFNLYGQVKFHKEVISLKYLKQLIKDKLYRILIENNKFMECQQAIFISHNGFTEKAKIYAKKNNMIILDTSDIIRIILSGDTKNSLEFINKKYEEIKSLN